jgi:hypothetical protein
LWQRNGAFIALGVHPLGNGTFAEFAEEDQSLSLKPETMVIFALAFAVLKNN